MQSAQTSPTKLKANVIPFPAPSQLSSRSPEEAAAQSPPFELRDERSKGRELAAPIYASVPTPSTAHLREAVGNEEARPIRQLDLIPTVPDQPPFTANSLGIAFRTSTGHTPPQTHATAAPLQSPLRFPASEHPLPPLKSRSTSLGGAISSLGPSPPLPPPLDLSAHAPLTRQCSSRPGDELQKGYELDWPEIPLPGAPSLLQYPHLHPSPPDLHHYHSFPALPQHPYAFSFPPAPPYPSAPLGLSHYAPPSPALYPSPRTPQLYPTGPPFLRHHHSFSYSSTQSSQSAGASTSFDTSPTAPLNHSFPASPPLLALSAIDQAERCSDSSSNTTCDVWDCFALATGEVSPCSCLLCHRHLRIVLHGARVVKAPKKGGRAAGDEEDIAAQGRMKKLFECVGCRTQSQAVEKGMKEEQEDLAVGLDEFELGYFGVRDLPASPVTESTSPSPSSPPTRPYKVTLPSTIVQPVFPLTQVVTSRSRSASSPAAVTLPESANLMPRVPFVRERVYSAPFSFSGNRLWSQEPPDNTSVSAPNVAPSSKADRKILRLDNIPWLVTIAEVAEWLPEGCRPRLDTPSPPIYIILHRETGRTLSRCFVDTLGPEAILQVLETRQGMMLRERPIGVMAVPHDELLQALFHQVPKGMKLEQASPCDFPPLLPPKQELDLLVEACRKGGSGASPALSLIFRNFTDFGPKQRRTVSYHPEHPFLNIVQLIEKFPWSNQELWTSGGVQKLFGCAEEATRIAISTTQRDKRFAGLVERLKSIVMLSPGKQDWFSPEQKTRMSNVQPRGSLRFGESAASNSIRHRKSFPSHPNPPRAFNDHFQIQPSSPTSYRPRRGSLLGPNGTARRPGLVATPNEYALFPPLPSPIEHQPTTLPLSPPETPRSMSNLPLIGSSPQARRTKSVGLLSGKPEWEAKGGAD